MLGENQDLIRQYRLITKYLLEKAPNAAFNVPGFNWPRKPLLVAGRIATVNGRIAGPRIAFVYADKGQGLGFYFCAHGLGESKISQPIDINHAHCDQQNIFRLIGGRIALIDEDIPNNLVILSPVMQRLNNEIAANPHNNNFLEEHFPNGLLSPLYPKIIPRQNDK